MRSTTIFTLIGTYATVATMANPLARIDPKPQINANCAGPIVNLVAFAGANCSTTDTATTDDYESVALTKFSAVPSTSGSGFTYKSGCKSIIDSDFPALSVIYTSDGANQRKCTLDLFSDSNCQDKDYSVKSLINDVSSCQNVQAASAQVSCTKTTTNDTAARNGTLDPKPQGARWS
ncbi:hypothetical protein Q7P36_010951 [Cladosporium allicinum]